MYIYIYIHVYIYIYMYKYLFINMKRMVKKGGRSKGREGERHRCEGTELHRYTDT